MRSIKLFLIVFVTIFALTFQTGKFEDLPMNLIEVDDETFDMFLKFAEDEKEEEEKKVEPKKEDAPEKPNMFETLFASFMKVTNNWKQIVDTFKSGRSQEIMEKLKGKGFEYFSQDAQVQITTGIKEEYFDKFVASLMKRIKVPEGRQDDIESAVEVARFADRQMWSAFNTLFNVDEGGNVKFASVLINRNEKGGKDFFDFVFTDLKSTFKLAPDVTVVNKKLIVLGGIWSENEIVLEKHPKTFTPDDIEVVMSFFQIVTFKCFANHFGVKMEFPKL